MHMRNEPKLLKQKAHLVSDNKKYKLKDFFIIFIAIYQVHF